MVRFAETAFSLRWVANGDADAGEPAREEPATAVHAQYVWDERYIDAPVLRDRDADGDAETGDLGGDGEPSNGDSGLEERLYYVNDANFSTTAVVDGTPESAAEGDVIERYSYTPYGLATFHEADWTPTAGPDGQSGTADDGTSGDYANEVLYAGYRPDGESGLYHVRNRYYHPTLGRFVSRDPSGYTDGMGLYTYAGDGPPYGSDSLGLEDNVRGLPGETRSQKAMRAERARAAIQHMLQVFEEDYSRAKAEKRRSESSLSDKLHPPHPLRAGGSSPAKSDFLSLEAAAAGAVVAVFAAT